MAKRLYVHRNDLRALGDGMADVRCTQDVYDMVNRKTYAKDEDDKVAGDAEVSIGLVVLRPPAAPGALLLARPMSPWLAPRFRARWGDRWTVVHKVQLDPGDDPNTRVERVAALAVVEYLTVNYSWDHREVNLAMIQLNMGPLRDPDSEETDDSLKLVVGYVPAPLHGDVVTTRRDGLPAVWCTPEQVRSPLFDMPSVAATDRMRGRIPPREDISVKYLYPDGPPPA